MNTIDLTNKVFNRLTVLTSAGKNTYGYTTWNCLCNCGNKVIVSGYSLRNNRTRSCGCMRRKYLPGDRIGKLVILKYIYRDNKCPSYNCKCDCGKFTTVQSSNLTNGHTKSCGCSINELSPKSLVGFNMLIHTYIIRAKKTGVKFSLTEKEFRKLTSSNCYYCNDVPRQVKFLNSKKLSKRTVDNSKYIYNSLDRIDSNKGYIIDNVLPCCNTCNTAKLDMSITNFKSWVKRVYENLWL